MPACHEASMSINHLNGDPTLPVYYLIVNYLIMVDALDTWKEANMYLLAAE